MRRTIKTSLWIVSLITLAGCDVFLSKPDGVTQIDLTDAYYIGIDISKNSSEEGINNLVKVSDRQDLTVYENVEFLDNEGKILGEDIIHADAWTIHTVSDKFTIVAGEFIFKQKDGEKRHFGLLVNNLSGAIYGLEEYYFPDQRWGLTGKHYYQTDSDGNIYFVNPTDAHMYRILTGEDTNIQLERYIDGASGINGDRYLVDSDGNVYFRNGSKVKKNTGGIEDTGMQLVAVIGSDGNCYGFGQEWPGNLSMYKLEVIDGQFKATKLTDSGYWFEAGIEVSYQFLDPSNHRFIIMGEGYIVPERSFSNERVIGVIFDELTYYVTPILQSDSKYYSVLGPENDFLWTVVESTMRFEAFDITSLQIDHTRNTANITESIVVDIPAGLDINSVLMDECGFGINISGFIPTDETRFSGKITAEDGLRYYKEELVPFITTLSRIN